MADLSIDLGFRVLRSPLMTASGTFGQAEEFRPVLDLDLLGAIVFKGVYLEARPGNPPPRLHETPAGLLNSVGLAGPGADAMAARIRKVAELTSTPLVVNVCGGDDREFVSVAEVFEALPEAAMLELNISCPNVHLGGRCAAQDAKHTGRLVKLVRRRVSKPLLVKLSPNVPDIAPIARAAEAAGADALTVANTFLGLAVDLEKRRPVFRRFYAGLSGPAIKPLALRLVYEAVQSVKIPVIGCGGISSGRDLLEFIMVGAAAVQIGTVNLVEPGAAARILAEAAELMDRLGIESLAGLRGSLQN